MAAELTLSIERPVAGGRMIARHEGRVVLVSGAIPGERVVARLEPSPKKVAFATTVGVLDASPDRRTPACDLACGGSAYAHIAPARQRLLKAEIIADAFRRIGKMVLDAPVEVAASPEAGYRLRARLHVRQGRAGFFVEGSHRLCDAAATGQVAPAGMAAVGDVLAQLGDRVGDCDEVWLAENVAGTAHVCHVEPAAGRTFDAGEREWRSGPGLTGITTRHDDRLVVLAGVGRVSDSAAELCGATDELPADVTLSRSAVSFFQGNRYLTGALLLRVLAAIQGSRVLDLYAGVGLFSVPMAARGAVVSAVEGDPASVGDLEVNSACARGRLTIRQAAVETALLTDLPGSFDTVVLDPPRTGATPEAVTGIAALGAPRLVYVSCDPATLARDAAAFVAKGYRLAGIEAFDMFPNTPHVESLAIFDRQE